MNSFFGLRPLLVTAVLLACSLSSFAQREERIDTALLRKNNFRKATIRIVYPLDEIEGKPGKTSLEITYDNKGRKLSTYVPTNDSTGNLSTFRYNGNGQLTEYKGVFGSSDSNRVVSFYDNAGNMIRSDTYHRGNPGESWHYGFDGNHNKLWEVRLSVNDDTISRYDYFYKNNRLDKERYSAHGVFKGEYTYQYDANGNEIGKKITDGTLLLAFPSQEYNNRNELVKEFYYSSESGKPEVVQTRYNTWVNGKLVKERVVYPDGKEMVSIVNSYYPNGLIRETRSSGGEAKNVYEDQYLYTSDGRLERKIRFTGAKEQSYYVYGYDKAGRLAREQRFHADELQTTHLYTYDAQGRRVSSQFIGKQIHDPYFRRYGESPYGRGMNDTVTETYVYAADTQRVATYATLRLAALPKFYSRFGFWVEEHHVVPQEKRYIGQYDVDSDKRYRGEFDLYGGTYLDKVELISRKVTGGDTLSTYRIGVFRKSPPEEQHHFLGFVTRTETTYGGMRAFTDKDATGRVLTDVTFANGVYTIRHIKDFYVRSGTTGVLYHCPFVYTGDSLRSDVYDATGKLVSHTYNEKYEAPSKTFVYDAAGRLARMTEHCRPYRPTMFYTTDYSYNAAGLLQTETRYDNNGAISYKKQFFYNGQKVVKMKSEMPGSEMVYRFSYE